jgi:hypothetical protein
MLLVSLFTCMASAAQTPPAPTEAPEQLEGRKNQRIERIHVEDAGVKIDELRYGGQTQSIKVQPKANVPEYEIQPPNLAHSRPADERGGLGNATGQRVWNLFSF